MSLVATTTPNQPATRQACTGAELVEGFRAAGLPIADIVTYTEETDPNKLMGRLGGYVEKLAWVDTRIAEPRASGVDAGGSIERFGAASDAETRDKYLAALDGGIFGDGYRYRAGTMLVRLGKALTPSQADGYRARLIELCSD